ncbi:YcaO-like family protein [Streptomyces sp. NBC_01264]|uniref:YcaO-like family protein n=1 Tax=Streptomyces sp. NBC_01264 TaxID=2903804 RepID=UPI00225C3035|nr:YcaO-like family protein [Streptomyces sp. NBC_01264]MCX4783748.1 YcaO-like family protein [Streptomyces sp. NBC_01264]
MKKVHFAGTHRVRHPEETWARLDELRDSFGITRVADVTGLDTLGVPVVAAVRPAARTRPLAYGRGATPLLARISAVMESVELWHAEYACPPAEVLRTPARELALPYDVRALPLRPGSLLSEHTPLDWVIGSDLVTGAPVAAPRACVAMGEETGTEWRPPLLRTTADGLAGGNSYEETVVHALYKVIEQDCALTPASRTKAPPAPAPAPLAAGFDTTGPVDPAGVDDPLCAEVLARLAAAGVRVTLTRRANRWALPCFSVGLWSKSFPVPVTAVGVHSDPGIALGRALTGAARDRLRALVGDGPAAASGARARPPRAARAAGAPAGRPLDWREASLHAAEFAEDTDEMRWLAGLVTAVTGHRPVAVDLSTETDFRVVKVVAAGLTAPAAGPVRLPGERR